MRDHVGCGNDYTMNEQDQDRRHDRELEKTKDNLRKEEDGALDGFLDNLFEERP